MTSQSCDGKNGDIEYYNQFVNDVANSANIGDRQSERSPVGPITWFAIVSTEKTAAKENARIVAPVYNTVGDLIVKNQAELWAGELRHPIAVSESGTRLPSFYGNNPKMGYFVTVFTGTTRDGTPHATQALGAKPVNGQLAFRYGNVNATNDHWISNAQHRAGFKRPIYALSEKLTVP